MPGGGRHAATNAVSDTPCPAAHACRVGSPGKGARGGSSTTTAGLPDPGLPGRENALNR